MSDAALTPDVMPAEEEFADIRLGDHFTLSPTGLIVKGKPSFNECHAMFLSLRTLERGLQIAIGDAIKYIRDRFGERADQIISAATGWTAETARNYEWVAERVTPDRRHPALTISHYQAVAALQPKEQKKWLEKAIAPIEDGGEVWKVSRLKAAVKHGDDLPVTKHMLVVECVSEKDREDLQNELVGRGYQCHASDSRRKA